MNSKKQWQTGQKQKLFCSVWDGDPGGLWAKESCWLLLRIPQNRDSWKLRAVLGGYRDGPGKKSWWRGVAWMRWYETVMFWSCIVPITRIWVSHSPTSPSRGIHPPHSPLAPKNSLLLWISAVVSTAKISWIFHFFHGYALFLGAWDLAVPLEHHLPVSLSLWDYSAQTPDLRPGSLGSVLLCFCCIQTHFYLLLYSKS